ncbi:MAG: vitamin B12-dependent ribonucleotide reductase [Candidatus Aenigmarchaeota archaeon]|nr:vitamin B12-dependent ribonucleotide reductase [Candidatus Aenigmarchaeota archaeon]
MISQIKKRDGRVVDFDKEKITNAIFKAAQSVGGKDRELAERLASQVVEILEKQLKPGETPTVEQVQDIVEKILVENGHYKTAKAYILHRQKRAEVRRAKALLGVRDELKLSLNAILVLERRYLRKDETGRVIESTSEMFRRVARAIAEVERDYGKSEEEIKEIEDKFYQMMSKLEFLPNSPTLMNAGSNSELGLSACYVLPVEDSIKSIFDAVKWTALIHKSGGGTGYSFSRLRPVGDVVKTTGGVASGPVSFMKVFDATTETIKQGGRRRGAMMGILRVDHPDILDFIVCKEREGTLRNFNISVAVTDKFMRAVEKDEDFELINPRTKRAVKRLKARAIWNLIITMAWKNGEPGVIFIDTINKANPTPAIGEIESTNPCGEVPLLPYESCNLGSINLSKFVTDGKIDYEKLGEVVKLATRFLDNVIDANKYPVPEIEQMTKANRKIGLGVMGFADMLIQLGIPYNSEEALKVANEVMKFICQKARETSVELGKEKGSFPNFKGSIFDGKYEAMRNATVTTIAPTGSIGVIANCSQGIEPIFAVCYMREVSESLGKSLIEINQLFENIAIKEGFYTEDLIQKISGKTSVQDVEEIPEGIRKVFVTAHDISPEWHVRMQAEFQKFTDNAVSKTINFPNSATPHDVEKAYLLAYKSGCKGITIYRHGSREVQVLRPVGEISLESSEPCPTCTLYS